MTPKKDTKFTKGNPKEGQNTQDIKDLEYILKSLNPLPAIVLTILKLTAPILARIGIRLALGYAVKKKWIKALTPVQRDATATAGATSMRAILENILTTIKTE